MNDISSPNDGQRKKGGNSFSLNGARHIRDAVRGISLAERAVLYDANVRANAQHQFFIKTETWAKALEVPESSLRRYVDGLVKKGFLKRQRRLKQCNLYTVLPNRSPMSGKESSFSSPVSGTHRSPMSGTHRSQVSGLKTALKEDSLMEENSTSDASASHGNEEPSPQEQKKEKSGGGGITALQLIARAEKAKAVAAKFPTAGEDHEARWGLLCELTKEFHPDIAALIGHSQFQKLVRPLDRFAKGLAKEWQAEAVSQALGECFALSTVFPELPSYAGTYVPEQTAAAVRKFLTKIADGIGDGSIDDPDIPYQFRITPLAGTAISITEVQ